MPGKDRRDSLLVARRGNCLSALNRRAWARDHAEYAAQYPQIPRHATREATCFLAQWSVMLLLHGSGDSANRFDISDSTQRAATRACSLLPVTSLASVFAATRPAIHVAVRRLGSGEQRSAGPRSRLSMGRHSPASAVNESTRSGVVWLRRT